MPEREVLEFDVLIVGAGPSGLAAAYHLRRLLDENQCGDMSVAVLEKSREIGGHVMSGAVMDPRGMDELLPDWKSRGAPVERPVERDELVFLTRNRRWRLPVTPPPLRNGGH